MKTQMDRIPFSWRNKRNVFNSKNLTILLRNDVVKELKVGVVGFGTVGAGVVENLLRNREVIAKRTGVMLTLTCVADLDTTTDRGIKLPEGVLCNDASEAIKRCDIVVELVGGTTFAKKLILDALNAGKSVVTANKALLALHGEELFAAAEKNGVDLYYVVYQ